MTKKWYILPILLVVISLLSDSCESEHNSSQKEKKSEKDSSSSRYAGHSSDAKYVGMNTCKQCHQKIYNTFIETGMGKSFDIATKEKSSGNFQNAYVRDDSGNFNYHAFWSHDSLFFKEYRLEKRDTVFSRTEQVNYIIGSGQHTNSHIQNVNGYFNQMPMTYYTQKKHWDLPPGFENGFNTHFTRKIGLECMSCHNAYPDFVMGSENKFKSVPRGIDCERCHGPGSFHVKERQTNSPVDTSKYIDYSIVNPAKLPVDLQFDICQRCHLQGNAVLKKGASFYDFKPGKKLSDFISVFLPKYKNVDDEFIMASHADRLKQSPCFIKSLEKSSNTNSLKPYKDAMTCITCHNPHVSVRSTNSDVFNDACNNCHQPKGKSDLLCTEKNVSAARNAKSGHAHQKFKDCVSCHMPVSGSTDIPHVSVHDHYIRKPLSKKEKDKIREFIGLYSVNEKSPDAITKAKAYIQQYSKFDQQKFYLDSAERLLSDKGISLQKNLSMLLEINFIRQNFSKMILYVNEVGEDKCISIFSVQSYDNQDAWACYHISEAYTNTNALLKALKFLKQAVKLAPYNLEFRNKLGSVYATMNDLKSAETEFSFILAENPKHVSAYTNLGYIKLSQGAAQEALRLYQLGLKYDPDYEPLLLNLAGYYAFERNKEKSVYYLQKILKKNPGNQKAKAALQQVNSLL